MKQIIKWEEVKGNLIEIEPDSYGNMILKFSDGRFAYFTSDVTDDGGADINLSDELPDSDDLQEMGIKE